MEPVIFNHTAHKALWDWLSKNPKGLKNEWPGWKRNGGKYSDMPCDCFACGANDDYSRALHYGKLYSSCGYCPLYDNRHKDCLGGLYEKWIYAKKYEEKSELALIIRDLPVRNIPNMVVK